MLVGGCPGAARKEGERVSRTPAELAERVTTMTKRFTHDSFSSKRKGILKLYHNRSGDSCLATVTICGPEGTFTHGFFADPADEGEDPRFAVQTTEYLESHNVDLVGICEDVEFVLEAFCDCCGTLRDADPEDVDYWEE